MQRAEMLNVPGLNEFNVNQTVVWAMYRIACFLPAVTWLKIEHTVICYLKNSGSGARVVRKCDSRASPEREKGGSGARVVRKL